MLEENTICPSAEVASLDAQPCGAVKVVIASGGGAEGGREAAPLDRASKGLGRYQRLCLCPDQSIRLDFIHRAGSTLCRVWTRARTARLGGAQAQQVCGARGPGTHVVEVGCRLHFGFLHAPKRYRVLFQIMLLARGTGVGVRVRGEV